VADLEDRAGLFAFAQFHVARLAAQPGAVALGAGLHAAIAREFFPHRHRVGLAEAPLHVGQDAFERMLLAHLAARRRTGLHGVAEADLFVARAAQHHQLHLRRQILERDVDVELVVLGQALDQGEVIRVAPVPALDRAAGQAERGKGDHPRGVEELHVAQAVAGGAGTHRRVEGEQAGLEFADRVVADGAGELGVEHVFDAAIHFERNGAAVGQPQRRLEAFGQPLLHVGADLEPVDHHVDVVLFGFLQLGQFVEFVGLAVDPEAHIAARLHLGEDIEKLALAVARHRRQDHELRLFRQGKHRVHHLRHGLRLQRDIVIRAVGRAGPGEQQPQIIVDLGDGAHRGARVVAGGLLLDRDGRRQALDQVDIRLVHQLQELAGVGRQALDVAPLAFGVQRVERQRRLARARQAGDHHQLVARDVEVDVLEVVGARAADRDPALHGCGQVGAVGAVIVKEFAVCGRVQRGCSGETQHDRPAGGAGRRAAGPIHDNGGPAGFFNPAGLTATAFS